MPSFEQVLNRAIAQSQFIGARPQQPINGVGPADAFEGAQSEARAFILDEELADPECTGQTPQLMHRGAYVQRKSLDDLLRGEETLKIQNVTQRRGVRLFRVHAWIMDVLPRQICRGQL